MNTIKQTLFALLIVAIAIAGCKKETQNEQKNTEIAAFAPSAEITVNNGMLVFKTKADMDVTMLEITASDRQAVDAWEQKMGIQTPASVFNKVVAAEDSVSKHYENLPQEEQNYWLTQPQVHSEIYNKAHALGFIQEVKGLDGNVYFDYNLSDNAMNSVVNSDGFVIVEGRIFQYTPDATKTILNGDVKLITSLKSLNTTCTTENIIVQMTKDAVPMRMSKQVQGGVYPGFNWTQKKLGLPDPYDGDGWYRWDKNWKGNYTKRKRVWIDGHSERYGTNNNPTCNSAVNCTYIVRAEYQELNFWGTWKYTNNSQSFTMSATWSYQYGKYVDVSYGCGSNPDWFYYVSPYNCGGAINCPTSPYSYSYPSVNNAFINLTPHGTWIVSNGPWFSDAFLVYSATLNSTIGGLAFNYVY
jgi:hypothetical protein